MSDITVINDSEQSDLVTGGLARNGELYLKAEGSTDAGSIVVYDNGSWKKFANEASDYTNLYAINFDAANDFLFLSSVLTLQSSTGYTISAWINSTRQTGYNHILKGSANDYLSIYNDQIWLNGTGTYKIIPNTTSNADDLQGWHHHVITFDGSVAKYYLDGVYEGSISGNIGDLPISTVSVSATYQFGGYMSDMALFNSALTDGSASIGGLAGGEIALLRDNGKPIDISTLGLDIAAWWRFGDDSNDSPSDGQPVSSITDSSGNGYTLTGSGTTAPTYYELPSDNPQRVT